MSPPEADGSLSLRKQVEDRLRRAIVKGDFAPGAHLPDRALCDTYKVSRAIVREAVRQLEAEGLVVSIPNRGSFVGELTAEEAKQIYDVRAVLEAWAAREFVQLATDAQLEEMVSELEGQKTAIESRQQLDMVEHKQIYYDMLFAVYRNPHMQDMLNRAQNWSGQLRALVMMVPERALNSVATWSA